MKKSVIKKLALESYSKNELDRDKIAKITKNLKREDLRVYIKDLKILEAKKTVTITLPSEDGLREIQNHFTKIYPDKKLIFAIDPSLLTGIKVVDYDNEYELSLKGFLESSVKAKTND
jgi:F0F1-type ATP synthase delta subunit